MTRVEACRAFKYGLTKFAESAEEKSDKTLRHAVAGASGVAGTLAGHSVMSRRERDAKIMAKKLNLFYGLSKKKTRFRGGKVPMKALKSLAYGGIPAAAVGYGATALLQRSGKKNKELNKYRYLYGDSGEEQM